MERCRLIVGVGAALARGGHRAAFPEVFSSRAERVEVSLMAGALGGLGWAAGLVLAAPLPLAAPYPSSAAAAAAAACAVVALVAVWGLALPWAKQMRRTMMLKVSCEENKEDKKRARH